MSQSAFSGGSYYKDLTSIFLLTHYFAVVFPSFSALSILPIIPYRGHETCSKKERKHTYIYKKIWIQGSYTLQSIPFRSWCPWHRSWSILIFLLKKREFSSCLIVSGKELQAIAALCLNERRPCSILGLDTTTFNDFLRL